MKQAFINWSGGKDAALCLHKILQKKDFDIRYLLTTMNAEYRRISMHGVREELLREQCRQIGIPLKMLYLPDQADMETYNTVMQEQLRLFLKEGTNHAVFGDIFLEDLRQYREEQLSRWNIKPVFPLWHKDTAVLIRHFLDAGFKAVIICVNADLLDKDFAGRDIDRSFIDDLPSGVDPCGENGEFHSFVYDGPIFKKAVNFTKGAVTERIYKASADKGLSWDTRFYFCDLIP